MPDHPQTFAVPAEAQWALFNLADEVGEEFDADSLAADVRTITRPVLVAYLRRLATFEEFAPVRSKLLGHAVVLDGGA